MLNSQNPGIFFWPNGGKGREWWQEHFHGRFGEYPRVFIDDAWASDWNVIADSLPDSLEYGSNDNVFSKNKNVFVDFVASARASSSVDEDVGDFVTVHVRFESTRPVGSQQLAWKRLREN